MWGLVAASCSLTPPVARSHGVEMSFSRHTVPSGEARPSPVWLPRTLPAPKTQPTRPSGGSQNTPHRAHSVCTRACWGVPGPWCPAMHLEIATWQVCTLGSRTPGPQVSVATRGPGSSAAEAVLQRLGNLVFALRCLKVFPFFTFQEKILLPLPGDSSPSVLRTASEWNKAVPNSRMSAWGPHHQGTALSSSSTTPVR